MNLPLTLTQQDIYFDQLYYGESPLYNIGGYISLGSIDPSRLAEAHETLVLNHDIFGLRLHCGDGDVVQTVSGERPVELPLIDFSAAEQPGKAADEWLSERFEQSMTLDNQPLCRVWLLKLTEDSWRYVGLAHHLMIDGWGFANWARLLGELYQGNSQSGMRWMDIVAKQADYQKSARYEVDRQYWREYLKNLPEPLFRPAYRAAWSDVSAVPSQRHIVKVSPHLHKQLVELARKDRVHVTQLYLAMTAIYCTKTYDKTELIFGLPAHSRNNSLSKQSIGVFTSVSPLRIVISSDDTLADLCRRIGTEQKRNYRHQRFPIGEMVRDLPNVLGVDRLYQVGFNYLKLDSRIELENNTAQLVYLSHNHEQTPLMVNIWEYGEGQPIEIQIDYNLGWFNETEIERMGHRMLALLECWLSDPTVTCGQVKMLPEEELMQLMQWSKGRRTEAPAEHTIHQLFEYQVALKPQHLALTHLGEQVSYRQLNAHANQVAHMLLASDVRVGEPVGIALPRSVNMVAAVLAVLKVGAVYVPLDPEYPQTRIDAIIADSGMSVILSEQNIAWRHASQQCLLLDKHHLRQYPESPVNVNVEPEQPAYILYTSGSTGQPKGVIVRHRNVCALLDWAKQTYREGELAVVLASTSLNFDISVFELFTPLCLGYRCELVKDILHLLDNPSDATLVNTVPSAMRAILEQQALPSSVKVVNLAGERLLAATVNGLLQRDNCERVFNLYGPTEDTVYSTFAEFTETLDEEPVIGQVVDDSQAYVLNRDHQLCGIDCSGELFLGGAGVALGYHGQPELTDSRFIKNPFGSGKLYRTGDLVKYRSDGRLVYLGRMDEQIKFRGFRIEVGEIEHQLVSCCGVEAAIVVAREHPNTGLQLVAYVVPTKNQRADEHFKLRIQEKVEYVLPFYMHPAVYHYMKALPLTPNGKVDKKSLPEPTIPVIAKEQKAPVNETECELVSIWAELLGIEPHEISTDTDFFSLGGHSLLMVKLQGRIREKFGNELPLQSLFNANTVGSQAKVMEEQLNSEIVAPISAIPRITDKLPMSFAQQRLWFIDELQGGSPEYNMPIALEVTGALDLELVSRVFEHIIERHEVLRSVYEIEEGEAKQRIRPMSKVQFAIQIEDLSEFTREMQSTAIKDQVDADVGRPFDLSSDLMIRVSYLKTAADAGVLLFNMHHIASDGWSLEVLTKEFFTLYEAFYRGDSSPLPDLTIQYADYAHWQRTCLEKDVLDKQLDYWTTQLDEVPAVHSLPLTYPRPLVKQHVGAVRSGLLPAAVGQSLQNLAKQYQLTPFMLLHGALSLLLSRHSHSDDIVIGTPVANRMQEELSPLIGFFVNTLVLRVNTSHSSLSDYFSHIRQVHLDAQSNQYVPFGQLVERLKVPRSTSYSPLFQVMLTTNTDYGVHNEGEALLREAIQLPGIEVGLYQSDTVQAKFDLNIDLSINDAGVSLKWTYDVGLFDEASITRLNDHLCRLLIGMSEVSSGEVSPHSLPMLSKNEMQHLIYELNDTAAEYPGDKCIHELFEEYTKVHPDNVAVVFDQRHLTYEELNARANQLAHYLVEHHDIKPDSLVGLCVERSLEMVIGILGILKAGGAYVPLDPSYPQERLSYMMTDASLGVVVSQVGVREVLKNYSGGLIELDNPTLMRNYSTLNLNLSSQGLTSSHLAYVIYTSGSTGKPKGVLTEHRALLSYASGFEKQAALCHKGYRHGWLWLSSFSFDASLKGIYLLSTGVKLIVPSQSELLTPPKLVELINQYQVGIVNCAPQLLATLIEEVEFPAVDLISSGDSLGEATLKTLREFALKHERVLINAYGPTETTINSSFSVQSLYEKEVIGKALANTSLFVLSKTQTLVPKGSIGELYIGGAGLARGYLNRPELTADRFIANPYYDEREPKSSTRLYRTGDLVRYLPDGNLEFIGRVDDQVKIRGFRIELGEISHQLNQIPEIDSVLVMAVEKAGGPQLLAYFKASDQLDSATEQTLIAHCKQTLSTNLPDYMVPNSFISVDEWPLNSNGKVERRALPSPIFQGRNEAYLAPADDMQILLQAIWAELLGRDTDQISCDANFFQLGGHSLLLSRMLHLLKERIGVQLTVKDVFESPTVVQLSNLLEVTNNPVMPEFEHYSIEGRHPLSFSQYRLWFVESRGIASAQNHIVGGLHIRGELDVEKINTALQQVFLSHPTLNSQIVMNDSVAMQEVAREIVPALEFIDLSKQEGAVQKQKLQELTAGQAARPFDIYQAPLYSMMLVQLDAAHYVLSANFHHLIFDGWSTSIFINKLLQQYAHLCSGTVPHLEQSPYNYFDYCHWQKKLLDSAHTQNERDFWRQYLEGANGYIDYPFYHSAIAESSDANTLELTFDIALIEQAKTLAQRCQGSLFNVMQSTFSLLLTRLSGESDIIVGLPVSGRNNFDVKDMLGVFVNNLPLRSHVDFNQPFISFLEQQVMNANQVLSHQDIPFEHIVGLAQNQRHEQQTPLFQILFNMLNLPSMDNRIAGLDITPMAIDNTESKFNLSLYLTPTSDGGLHLKAQFNQSKVSLAAVKQLCFQYRMLLEQVVTDAGLPCGQYGLANENPIARPIASQPYPGAIHQLVEHNGRKNPTRVALESSQGSMDYGTLQQKVSTLATRLLKSGVSSGDTVAIWASRSSELVIAILSTLSIGARFSLLSEELPTARARNQLLQLKAKLLLTTGPVSPLVQQLLREAEIAVLSSDCKQSGVLCEPTHFNLAMEPGDEAYVAFTSGSEGQPKPIIGSHGSLSAFTPALAQRFGLGQNHRFAMLSSRLHDPLLRDIFVPLALGATLVIPSPDLQDTLAIHRWLEKKQIDVVNLTPSLMNGVCQQSHHNTHLRYCFLGGEPLSTVVAEKIGRYAPQAQIVGVYGTTESGRALGYQVSRANPASITIPLGKAVGPAQLLVLNRFNLPCGIGEIGQIAIRSRYLTLGYGHDEVLTQERYLVDPTDKQSRIYLTGDLGYLLANGEIASMGRLDRQFKVRGYRIEPAEIEACLMQVSGVSNAACGVHKDANGQAQLVAAIVSDSVSAEQDVAVYLQEQLPRVMWPSVLRRVEHLPLTDNGKLNVAQVAELGSIDEIKKRAEPVTETERCLHTLWCEVLRQELVCVETGFFQLGGHSLLVSELLPKIKSHFGVSVDYQQFFAENTIRAVGSMLDRRILEKKSIEQKRKKLVF